MAEQDTYRTCRSCGFNGYMDRWFKKRIKPRLITFVLLLPGLIPGILFYVWGRRKLICPNCGEIQKLIKLKSLVDRSNVPWQGIDITNDSIVKTTVFCT